jgi:SAM-dependent methyltransferase
MPSAVNSPPEICDYENSPWHTQFWQGREYEDLAERVALKRLLPPRGARLCEIGAGVGRLAEYYVGYERVLLLDYARSMLDQAREKILTDPLLAPYASRYTLVLADLYNLPLADSALDTAVTVRVLHHVVDIPRAFAQIARAVRPGGMYVLEHANKRHLKAILRYALNRDSASPFSLEPYEFVKLNFDFHPRYIIDNLRAVNLAPQKKLAASFFRVAALKRLVPAKILAALDAGLQSPLAGLSITPSLFIRAESRKAGPPTLNSALWRDPACGSSDIAESPTELNCRSCGRVYPILEGIIDFKGGL